MLTNSNNLFISNISLWSDRDPPFIFSSMASSFYILLESHVNLYIEICGKNLDRLVNQADPDFKECSFRSSPICVDIGCDYRTRSLNFFVECMYFKVGISIIFTLCWILLARKHLYTAETHKRIYVDVGYNHGVYICRLSFETRKMNEENIAKLSGIDVNTI